MGVPLDVEKILEAGRQAPSGDNLQPWKFVLRAWNCIEVWEAEHFKNVLLNYKSISTIFSFGTMVENMHIAAETLGYSLSYVLFPNHNNKKHVLTLLLQPKKNELSVQHSKKLYACVPFRTTNRTRYRKAALSAAQKNSVLGIPKALSINGSVRIIEDEKHTALLTRLLTNSERLLFSSRLYHDTLFGTFRWNDREVMETKDGLDIETLEFSFLEDCMIRLLQWWPLVRIVRMFGASHIVAGQIRRRYLSSSALCAIVMPANTQEDFFNGGRIMERVWLESTTQGLSIQPIMAFVLLGQRVEYNDLAMFSDVQKALITKTYVQLKEIFSVGEGGMVAIFRIGHGKKPSAHSVRKELKDILEIVPTRH